MADNSTAEPGSLLDGIKKRREYLRTRDRHLDYDVPEYNGDLVVRFNPAPYEAVAAYQFTWDPAALFELDLDAIVRSCREILVRADGKLEPIKPGEQTTFATIDEALGFEAATAREAVKEVFASDLHVGECAAQLVGWSRAGDQEVDEQLAGEHMAGARSSTPASPKPSALTDGGSSPEPTPASDS